MSLTRIALRIAAVEAIKGRTLVGDNVLDSPNGALDIAADGTMRTDESRPFISVYTDDGGGEDGNGRTLTANGMCTLVIEAGISTAMTERNTETGTSEIVGIGLAPSDRAFEFFLDVVHRQALDALSDPDSEWAEIFRGLHYRITKVEVAGKRNANDQQLLAGHQTRITVELADDPVRGAPLDEGTPFADFLAALSATSDPVYQAQAATIAAVVGGNDPDWKLTQRRRGLTRAELLALGLGPIAGDLERATPAFVAGESTVAGNEPVVTP